GTAEGGGSAARVWVGGGAWGAAGGVPAAGGAVEEAGGGPAPPHHLTGAPALPDRTGRLLHVTIGSECQLPVGAPRRHQTDHADVHDQVAVVVHIVLDRAKDERPALHLLLVPALDQLLCLGLGERVPHLCAIVVA